MKIRSKGLGRRELDMDLREFTVERDGSGILLKGVTHAPITWETTVRVGPRDIGSILKLALRPSVLHLGLLWIFRRPDVPGRDHEGERLGGPTRLGRASLRSPVKAEGSTQADGAVQAEGTAQADGAPRVPRAVLPPRVARPARPPAPARAPRPDRPPRGPFREGGSVPSASQRADTAAGPEKD